MPSGSVRQSHLQGEFSGQLPIDASWPQGLQLSLLPDWIAPYSLPHRGEARLEGRAIAQKKQ